jgi:Ca-activated chloride channel family protein
MALAQPRARIAVSNKAGADIILLQDASASMYVSDVQPDRWRRSILFLRAFAERLSWKGDRMALALFAHRASPQLRLTKDPNALFFFLDHLGERSPFALENDTTWDTNIEEGVYWGLKLLEKDEQLFGRSKNAKAFVVVSDGQAWSGEVKNALEQAKARRIPLYVVGVGTVAGGMIPEPPAYEGDTPPGKIRSVLDRASLQEIARASGGEYFEIGQIPDDEVAFRIIRGVRNRAATIEHETSYEELYWRFLVAAAIALALSTLLMRRSVHLWWQLAGTSTALAVLLAIVT